MIGFALFAAAAWAQGTGPVPGDEDYVLPTLSVDSYKPSVDAIRTFSAEDSRRVEEFVGRIEGHWIQEPLVWYSDDGSEVALVDWVMAVNLSAAWGRGPARIGATVPLYLRAPSDYRTSAGTTPGDLSLDGKFSLREGAVDRIGVAAIGRLGVPSGASAFQLGQTGWSGELGVAADYEAGRALLVSNAYVQFLPETQLEAIVLDDQIGFRLGAGLALREGLSGSAELLIKTPLDADARDALSSPVELLVGATRRGDDGNVLRVGVGLGMVGGIGAPGFRVLFSLGHAAPPEVVASGDASAG